MASNEDITKLKNIVRIGAVSSVDRETRTARVNFTDKNNLVSGPLKIINNPPTVTAENIQLTYGVNAATVEYASESKEHTHTGKTESHTHKIIVSPWLPSVGDFVLCIYLPNGESDGFVIGGI